MGEDLARAFISFFAIIDPIGNLLVFYHLTQQFAYGQRLQVGAIAVVAAGAMLLVFSLGGQEVLDFMGISTESFQVAAGLLLLLPAYRLVAHGQSMDVAEGEEARPLDIALVPLATPLLAGPGALATAISFSDTLGTGTTVLAAGLVLALSFAAFAAAASILQWLGTATIKLLSRLVGILLFAIAIDFILEGVRSFFPGLASG